MVKDTATVRVVVSGVGRRAAFDATCRALADERRCPRLVVAAGFCGALAPDLRVGDVVAASEVVEPVGLAWRCVQSNEARAGRLLTVSELVAESSEKRLLHDDYEADVVDMESAGVAEACATRFAVPFLAVRAVSDTVDTALSPRLVRLLSGGRVSPLKAAAALARQPSLLAEFRRLARDTKVAARKLADALVEVIQGERRGLPPPSADAAHGRRG
jgi:adenosylhomocysteine nucleosidase